MAYLKQRGAKWYAVWNEGGKKQVKATGIPVRGAKEKKLAQATADAMEAATNESTTLRTALDAVRAAAKLAGIDARMPSIAEYFENYVPNGRPRNVMNCKRAISVFLKFLNGGASKKLNTLSSETCRAFCKAQLERIAFGTVKQYVAMLRPALNAAVRDGLLDKNPFSAVILAKLLPSDAPRAMVRLPFTLDEMRRLLTEAPSPWRELVAVSFFTGGQRIGDVVCLKWSSVNFDSNTISFQTRKTSKEICAPMVPFLRKTLLALYDEGNVYVFPDLARQYISATSKLSSQFITLLRFMGIVDNPVAPKTSGGNFFFQKSFHSIRHTVVSMLRSSNQFSADLAREIVGHDSEAVERAYFTPPIEAKLQGLSYLYEAIKAGPAQKTQSPPA